MFGCMSGSITIFCFRNASKRQSIVLQCYFDMLTTIFIKILLGNPKGFNNIMYDLIHEY